MILPFAPLNDGSPRSYIDRNFISIQNYINNQSTYNVKDYGAVGDGTTDDSTAFQDAVDACGTGGGGMVIVPPASYKLSSTINITANGIRIAGENEQSSLLIGGGSSVDMFHVYNGGANVNATQIDNLWIENCRTAIWLDAGCSRSQLYDLFIRNIVTGVRINGDYTSNPHKPNLLTYMERLDISYYTGQGISVYCASEIHWDDLQLFGNAASGTVGILLDTASNAVYAGRANLLASDYGLLVRDIVGISPNPMGTITKPSQMWFSQVLGDTCNIHGIYIQDGFQMKFQQCWASGSQTGNGWLIGANTEELEWEGCWAINNAQDGMRVVNDAKRGRVIGGCFISNSATSSGNFDGIAIEPGVLHYTIIGPHCYNSTTQGYGNTQRYGINLISGASNYLIVQGTNTVGNATGGLNNSSSGANNSFIGNV